MIRLESLNSVLTTFNESPTPLEALIYQVIDPLNFVLEILETVVEDSWSAVVRFHQQG